MVDIKIYYISPSLQLNINEFTQLKFLKMKKFVFSAAVLMATFGASAQGFYGDINVGYGFGAPGRLHNDGTGLGTTSHTDIVNGVQTTTRKAINGGVGGGINIQLTPGYMFNDHIGVELGLNYYLGNNVLVQEGTSSLTQTNVNINAMEWNSGSAHAKSGQFRILPTLVLSTGASNKVSGYAKLGLVLPIAGSTTLTSTTVDKEITGVNLNGPIIETETVESEMKIKGAFTVGFKGAAGVNFMVSDKIGIFAEAFFTNLHISRKSAEVTQYTVNGADRLGQMTNYAKEVEYVTELNASSNNFGYNASSNLNNARQELTSGNNYNQIGVAVGVKFNF